MNYSLKSKKVGVFSDIHIGLGQDSSMWHNVVLEFAEWAANVYKKAGINDIIIPGDIFHNRNEIVVNTLSTAKKFFDIFKKFRIFISTGNHDCYYKDRSDVNSISLLEGWDNIILSDKTVLNLNYGNKKISLIPWAIPFEEIPESDICFGHFEIQTFYMNTYKVCEHGFESKDLLNKSKFIISGHFHNRDERNYSKGKIVYLGSPYQQNFGDTGSSRGIYILNLESEELEFIENTISPKHIKIYLSELKSKKQDSSYLKNNVAKNHVSFVVDDEIDNAKLALISSNIQSLNPLSFRIDYKSVKSDFLIQASTPDYTFVDIENNINDFVFGMDVKYKPEIIKYLTDLYKELT